MTALLLKWFVRQTDDTPSARAAVGRLAGITGIVCNVLLFCGKLLVGILSGSVSVIADAVNNLSDASSSVITLLAFRISQKPADKDHPFGHARYEYLAGLFVAVLILLIGAQLAVTSVQKIFHPTAIAVSWVSAAVLIASILMKWWMTVFYRTLGKRIRSVTLKATSDDCRNDVIASLTVLVGCVTETLWEIHVDGFIGLAVAVFIVVSGLRLAREATSPLVGTTADKDLVNKLEALVGSHEKILGVHDLLIHDYGPGRCFASVHAELSAEESPMDCHDILDSIERKALEELHVQLVIHYDPVDVRNAERERLRTAVEEIVGALHEEFSIHDFRMVKTDGKKILAFDLIVPYSFHDRHGELKHQIDVALSEKGIEWDTDICFDEHEE